MMGVLCLWMGVMEVMERSGIARGLSRLLRPAIKSAASCPNMRGLWHNTTEFPIITDFPQFFD